MLPLGDELICYLQQEFQSPPMRITRGRPVPLYPSPGDWSVEVTGGTEDDRARVMSAARAFVAGWNLAAQREGAAR